MLSYGETFNKGAPQSPTQSTLPLCSLKTPLYSRIMQEIHPDTSYFAALAASLRPGSPTAKSYSQSAITWKMAFQMMTKIICKGTRTHPSPRKMAYCIISAAAGEHRYSSWGYPSMGMRYWLLMYLDFPCHKTTYTCRSTCSDT